MVRISELNIPTTFASIKELLDVSQKELSSVVALILGTGINSDSVSNIESSASVSTLTDSDGNEIVFLEFDYNKHLHTSFEVADDPDLFSLYVTSKIKGAKSTIIPFDQKLQILNGSSGNPIFVPYPEITSASHPEYTINLLFSVIYINGTPQRIENIGISSVNLDERYAQIFFEKITDGFVFPDPRTPTNQFSFIPITGAYLSQWFADFGNPIELSFSNLTLHLTSNPLILELYNIDTAVRKYYLIRSEVKTDVPYYEMTSTDSLKVHIPNEVLDEFPETSTYAKIYFSKVAEATNTPTTAFFKQFSIGLLGLLPDDTDLKIFAISKTTGEIIELVEKSNTLVGSLYDIDYATGRINVYNVGGVLPQDFYLAVSGYKYAPPLKPHNTNDYPNFISVWSGVGGAFIGNPTLSDTLYVYLLPKSNYRDLISFVSDDGKIVSAPQIQKFTNEIVIADTPIPDYVTIEPEEKFFKSLKVRPIKLGELTRSGSTFVFSANPLADSPYEKLLDLAQNLNLLSSSGAFESTSITQTKQVTYTTPITFIIDYLPTTTDEVAFFGLVGKVDIYSNIERKQYTVELGYYDHQTNVFTSVLNLGTFDSNVNNAFVEIVNTGFPTNSLWSTTSPQTNVYLALRFTITNPAAGETDYTYDLDSVVYINVRYSP